jgi:NTP pyrophosphatase (non-canonical NTP hydrolase)
MLDMNQIQKDLLKWQKEHFPGNAGHPEQMGLGMSEELGEIFEAVLNEFKILSILAEMGRSVGKSNHMILKAIQKYREGTHGMTDEVKTNIADGVYDTIIYGIQLLSELNIKFEEGFFKTVYEEVIKRDWNKVRNDEIEATNAENDSKTFNKIW